MAFTIITREHKDVLYTIAYRHLPVFELGIHVPNYSYYIQHVLSNQHDIFDTSFRPPKKISFGDVMELDEDKIDAVLQTIVLINNLVNELKHTPVETF
jgi:hypothetical protein